MRIKIREYKADESKIDKINKMTLNELVNETYDIKKRISNSSENCVEIRIYINEPNEEGFIHMELQGLERMVEEYKVTEDFGIVYIIVDGVKDIDGQRFREINSVINRFCDLSNSDIDIVKFINKVTDKCNKNDIIVY